jgi:hypothetical protein
MRTFAEAFAEIAALLRKECRLWADREPSVDVMSYGVAAWWYTPTGELVGDLTVLRAREKGARNKLLFHLTPEFCDDDSLHTVWVRACNIGSLAELIEKVADRYKLERFK